MLDGDIWIGGDYMYSLHGAQQIYVYEEKRIIKSSATGKTNEEEVQWLTDKMLEYSEEWKDCGWGYLVGIGDMEPVTAEVSAMLIEFHKKLESAGCKAIAFVESDAFVIAVQAKRHGKKSKTAYKEKHFKREKEAMDWLEKMLSV